MRATIRFVPAELPKPDVRKLHTIPDGLFTATGVGGFPSPKLGDSDVRHLFVKTQSGVTCLSEDRSKYNENPRHWPSSQGRYSPRWVYNDMPITNYKPAKSIDYTVEL